MGKHPSNEDLILQLYEVGGDDDAHLTECAECRERWERLLARRQSALEEPYVSPELLAAQRKEIYRRIEAGQSGFWHPRLAPALAALSVVVLGLVLSRPSPTPVPATMAANDSEFFTEIYTMIQSTEPDIATPLRGLFEE